MATNSKLYSSETLKDAGRLLKSNPMVTSWATTTSLALLLAAVGSGAMQRLGEDAFMALAGIGGAVAVCDRRRRAELKAARVDRSKLEAEQQQLAKDKEQLASQQRQLDQAEAKLTAFQASLKTEAATYKDRITVDQTRAAQAEAQKAIASMQTKLEQALADKAAVQAEYHGKAVDATKAAVQAIEDKKAVTAAAQQKYGELGNAAQQAIDTRDEVLADERMKVNAALEKLARQVQQLVGEIASYKEENARLRGPKQFTFSGVEADTGNQIQAFLAQRGVQLSCYDIGRRHYGTVPFFYEPVGATSLKDVENQLDDLHLNLGLYEVPRVSVDKGKIKMLVQISQEKAPKRDPIKYVSIGDLEKAFLPCFHIRVAGFTGSGKSTMLNNLIGLFEYDMGTRAIIFDPKVDFPSAQYPHNTVYRGGRRCVDRIDMVGNVVSVRQESKVLNDERGLPIPDLHQEPRLFLLDEVKDLYGACLEADDRQEKTKDKIYARQCRRSIQKGLEVGRGLSVRVIYSTVTNDSSDIGFKNNVFKQSATLYLGELAVTALNSDYLSSVSPEKKAQLKQEYAARVEAGQKRIALFYNGLTNQCFYFVAPPPGTWNFDEPVPQSPVLSPPNEAMLTSPDQPLASWESEAAPSLLAGNISKTAPDDSQGPPTLAQVLSDGVECPHCGTKTVRQKGKSIDEKGRIRMYCSKGKNGGCDVDTFRLKVR